MNNYPNIKNTTILVPAAGKLKGLIYFASSGEEASFLNVGSKLAIEIINSNYLRQDCVVNLLMAVKDKNNLIYNFRAFDKINILEVGDTKNICETIEIAINNIKTEWCLINPITGISNLILKNTPNIYFGDHEIPRENWSSLSFDSSKKAIFHKKSECDSLGKISYPFTGIIEAKTSDIKDALKRLKDDQKSDAINLAEILFMNSKVQLKFEPWLDIGHQATYADTKTRNFSSRYFNNLEFNKEKKSIVKTSQKKDKLIREFKYFSSIPKEYERYFPSLINLSDTKNSYKLELEYIGFPSLSELFLFGNIGLNGWDRIFSSINSLMDEFYKKEAVLSQNASELYSNKTKERVFELEKLLSEKRFKNLFNIYENQFKVNGIKFPPLKKSIKKVISYLENFECHRPFHFGHGDLCFNNILIDPIFANFKLIDPRADYNKDLGVYGLIDMKYDLAKLNHSLIGLYDSIVNNLYSLNSINNNEFQIKIYKPLNYKYISKEFSKRIISERISNDTLNFLTANLFFSMLPLHSEDVERMLLLSFAGSSFLQKDNLYISF